MNAHVSMARQRQSMPGAYRGWEKLVLAEQASDKFEAAMVQRRRVEGVTGGGGTTVASAMGSTGSASTQRRANRVRNSSMVAADSMGSTLPESAAVLDRPKGRMLL